MSLQNFSQNLKNLVEELNATREADSVLIATEAIALVRRRVQNEKVDKDGSAFGQYSQALVPRWYLYDRSNSQGADDRIRNGPWFQSYADLREANGLSSTDIDFTFSGEMFRNTGVTSVSSQGATVTVEVGGQTDSAQDKLDYQQERYGNIIALSKEEEIIVGEAYAERINNLITKFLG